jgi:nickel-dependent lactate racemase
MNLGDVTVGRSPALALGDRASDASIALAIPDVTRQLELPLALAALFERFPAIGPPVVGLGLHRRMCANELAPIAAWHPVQHDPDDTVETATVLGIPGRVARPIAVASWSISVGVAELHQYAGLSGGHKGVAVGCGGRETIAALHARSRVLAPGVQVGRLKGNPFRQAVDALGEAARCRLALVYVPALSLWIAGNPVAVLDEALARMEPWWPVGQRSEGVVLHVGGAKAMSFYQASRAATYLSESPSPPCAPGATIVLAARCVEGMGSEAGFSAALKSTSSPWGSLLAGVAPQGAGAQRAVMLARLARRYHLRVMGCENPGPLRDHGVDATREPAPTGPTWLQVPRPFEALPQWRAAAEPGLVETMPKTPH